MFPFVFQTVDPMPTNIPTSWTSYSHYKYKLGNGGAVSLIEAEQSPALRGALHGSGTRIRLHSAQQA